jgi:hypothetical protein
MNTSNFKQEVLNLIKDEGFGMTNSGRAQEHDIETGVNSEYLVDR